MTQQEIDDKVVQLEQIAADLKNTDRVIGIAIRYQNSTTTFISSTELSFSDMITSLTSKVNEEKKKVSKLTPDTE